MNTGPRSKFSLLPFAVRYKIICALHDGATVAMIMTDGEVLEAYRRVGMTPTKSSLDRIKNSREYKEITAKRTAMVQELQADQMTAAVLRESDAAGAVSEQMKLDVFRLIKDCIAANPEEPKEVERLVKSLTTLSNTAKDRKIAELEKQLASAKSEIERIKNEHGAEIKRLADENKVVADPQKVADELGRTLGLR